MIIILKNVFNVFFANFWYILFMQLIFVGGPLFLAYYSILNQNLNFEYFSWVLVFIFMTFLQLKFIERFSGRKFGKKILLYFVISLIMNFISSILVEFLSMYSSVIGFLWFIISPLYITYFVILINYDNINVKEVFFDFIKKKYLKYIKYMLIFIFILILLNLVLGLILYFLIFSYLNIQGATAVVYIFLLLLTGIIIFSISFVTIPIVIILIQKLLEEYRSEKEVIEIKE